MKKENKIFTAHPLLAKAKEERKGDFIPDPVFSKGTYKFYTKMTTDPRYEFRF